jgi:hypothetical protein
MTALGDIAAIPSNVTNDIFKRFASEFYLKGSSVLSADRRMRFSGSDFSSMFAEPNLIGTSLVIRRFADGVRFFISGHGEENSQESPGHRDIGFGFLGGGVHKVLSLFFLGLIGSAKDDGRFSESPAKGGGTGFGDSTAAGVSGGEFVVGRESGPEFEGVCIGESIKVSDFGGDDAGPDLVDAWNGLEQFRDRFALFRTIGEGDLQSKGLTLSLEQQDDVEKIFEGLSRFVLEQMAETEEPPLSEIPVEFGRSHKIGGVKNGLHAMFSPGECSGKLVPVSTEFSQASGFRVGDPAQRTLAPCQTFSDVSGVVEIGLSSFAATCGEFGGIGNADEIDLRTETVEKPFDKTDGFDGHPDRLRQRMEKVVDSFDAFGADGEFGGDVLLRIDGDEGDGAFVEIDADERAEDIDRPEFIIGMGVGHSERGIDFLSHEQNLQIKSLEKDAKL